MNQTIEQIRDEFATNEFIADNVYFYDLYIKDRVHGYPQRAAFCRSFGSEHLPDSLGGQLNRFDQMEATDYYRENFRRVLKSTPVDQLWNDRTSLHELLQIARDPVNKDSTRLSAVKELNVIVGITIETDQGKTKAVRALSDFYKDNTKPQADSKPLSEPAQTPPVQNDAASSKAG